MIQAIQARGHAPRETPASRRFWQRLRRVDPKNQAMKKKLTRVVTPSTFTVNKWVITLW